MNSDLLIRIQSYRSTEAVFYDPPSQPLWIYCHTCINWRAIYAFLLEQPKQQTLALKTAVLETNPLGRAADISGSILKRSEGIYQSSKWYCRLCTTCVTFQYTFSEVMKLMKCVQWTLHIWNMFLPENIYFVWKVMLIF